MIYEKQPEPPPRAFERAGYQPGRNRPGTAQSGDDIPAYQISVTPPGPGAIFGHLDSEANLQERIRQGKHDLPGGDRITFPPEPILSTSAYAGRHWPQLQEIAEPNYVTYGRMYFEQENSERYGWDLGLMQPFLSATVFYGQVITVPYQWAMDPLRKHDSNAGYCLPGDPVPYILYPPGLSLAGGLAEAAAIISIVAIFP